MELLELLAHDFQTDGVGLGFEAKVAVAARLTNDKDRGAELDAGNLHHAVALVSLLAGARGIVSLLSFHNSPWPS